MKAQAVPNELTVKLFGQNRVSFSPIVTIEPRRRKFHCPIQMRIPLPPSGGSLNSDRSGLRLLCSITGGTNKAQWEDVTGSTPLSLVDDCLIFDTTVSARFWLVDCRSAQASQDSTRYATELYEHIIRVPYMAKFLIFAKRRDINEANVRVFCMTDDREDKTLEGQEHFTEVAKSRDVEIVDGQKLFLEFAGNLWPTTLIKSNMQNTDQLGLRFVPFRENRLAFVVRIKDISQDPIARIAFMQDSLRMLARLQQQLPRYKSKAICNLNILLPGMCVSHEEILGTPKKNSHLAMAKIGDLTLADIANELDETDDSLGPQDQDLEWAALAPKLGIPRDEVDFIQASYEQNSLGQNKNITPALILLMHWYRLSSPATRDQDLGRALLSIGRNDIARKLNFAIEPRKMTRSTMELLKEIELIPVRSSDNIYAINQDQSGFYLHPTKLDRNLNIRSGSRSSVGDGGPDHRRSRTISEGGTDGKPYRRDSSSGPKLATSASMSGPTPRLEDSLSPIDSMETKVQTKGTTDDVPVRKRAKEQHHQVSSATGAIISSGYDDVNGGKTNDHNLAESSSGKQRPEFENNRPPTIKVKSASQCSRSNQTLDDDSDWAEEMSEKSATVEVSALSSIRDETKNNDRQYRTRKSSNDPVVEFATRMASQIQLDALKWTQEDDVGMHHIVEQTAILESKPKQRGKNSRRKSSVSERPTQIPESPESLTFGAPSSSSCHGRSEDNKDYSGESNMANVNGDSQQPHLTKRANSLVPRDLCPEAAEATSNERKTREAAGRDLDSSSGTEPSKAAAVATITGETHIERNSAGLKFQSYSHVQSSHADIHASLGGESAQESEQERAISVDQLTSKYNHCVTSPLCPLSESKLELELEPTQIGTDDSLEQPASGSFVTSESDCTTAISIGRQQHHHHQPSKCLDGSSSSSCSSTTIDAGRDLANVKTEEDNPVCKADFFAPICINGKQDLVAQPASIVEYLTGSSEAPATNDLNSSSGLEASNGCESSDAGALQSASHAPTLVPMASPPLEPKPKPKCEHEHENELGPPSAPSAPPPPPPPTTTTTTHATYQDHHSQQTVESRLEPAAIERDELALEDLATGRNEPTSFDSYKTETTTSPQTLAHLESNNRSFKSNETTTDTTDTTHNKQWPLDKCRDNNNSRGSKQRGSLPVELQSSGKRKLTNSSNSEEASSSNTNRSSYQQSADGSGSVSCISDEDLVERRATLSDNSYEDNEQTHRHGESSQLELAKSILIEQSRKVPDDLISSNFCHLDEELEAEDTATETITTTSNQMRHRFGDPDLEELDPPEIQHQTHRRTSAKEEKPILSSLTSTNKQALQSDLSSGPNNQSVNSPPNSIHSEWPAKKRPKSELVSTTNKEEENDHLSPSSLLSPIYGQQISDRSTSADTLSTSTLSLSSTSNSISTSNSNRPTGRESLQRRNQEEAHSHQGEGLENRHHQQSSQSHSSSIATPSQTRAITGTSTSASITTSTTADLSASYVTAPLGTTSSSSAALESAVSNMSVSVYETARSNLTPTPTPSSVTEYHSFHSHQNPISGGTSVSLSRGPLMDHNEHPGCSSSTCSSRAGDLSEDTATLTPAPEDLVADLDEVICDDNDDGQQDDDDGPRMIRSDDDHDQPFNRPEEEHSEHSKRESLGKRREAEEEDKRDDADDADDELVPDEQQLNRLLLSKRASEGTLKFGKFPVRKNSLPQVEEVPVGPSGRQQRPQSMIKEVMTRRVSGQSSSSQFLQQQQQQQPMDSGICPDNPPSIEGMRSREASSSSASLESRSPLHRRSRDSSIISQSSVTSSILSDHARNQLNFDLSPDLPPDSLLADSNSFQMYDDRPASPVPISPLSNSSNELRVDHCPHRPGSANWDIQIGRDHQDAMQERELSPCDSLSEFERLEQQLGGGSSASISDPVSPSAPGNYNGPSKKNSLSLIREGVEAINLATDRDREGNLPARDKGPEKDLSGANRNNRDNNGHSVGSVGDHGPSSGGDEDKVASHQESESLVTITTEEPKASINVSRHTKPTNDGSGEPPKKQIMQSKLAKTTTYGRSLSSASTSVSSSASPSSSSSKKTSAIVTNVIDRSNRSSSKDPKLDNLNTVAVAAAVAESSTTTSKYSRFGLRKSSTPSSTTSSSHRHSSLSPPNEPMITSKDNPTSATQRIKSPAGHTNRAGLSEARCSPSSPSPTHGTGTPTCRTPTIPRAHSSAASTCSTTSSTSSTTSSTSQLHQLHSVTSTSKKSANDDYRHIYFIEKTRKEMLRKQLISQKRPNEQQQHHYNRLSLLSPLAAPQATSSKTVIDQHHPSNLDQPVGLEAKQSPVGHRHRSSTSHTGHEAGGDEPEKLCYCISHDNL